MKMKTMNALFLCLCLAAITAAVTAVTAAVLATGESIRVKVEANDDIDELVKNLKKQFAAAS